MSRFTDAQTAVQPIGGKDWIVTDALVWEVGQLGSGIEFIVPVGAKTDLASIPRPLRLVLPPSGQPQVTAAVAHDHAYRVPQDRVRYMSRKREVDREFRLMMRALGTPLVRSWVIWAGVRVAFWAGTDWP